MSPRSLLFALAAGCLLVCAGGCAGSPPPAAVDAHAIAPGASSRHPDPNAPYMVPAPPRPSAPAPQPVSASAVATCNPQILSVEEVAGNSHQDYRSLKLAFRNRGNVACRLSGYPVVALLDAQGQNLGSIAMEKISPAEVLSELAETPTSSSAAASAADAGVVLPPHAVAAFQVVWTTGPDCTSVGRILVTAPGTQRAFTVTQPMRVCAGRVQISSLSLDQEDD